MDVTWEPMPEGWEPLSSDPPDQCPVGFGGHTWRFTIEESTVSLAPVEGCTGTCNWWDAEHLGRIDLGVVKLRMATDCPGHGAYESGNHYISHPNACDCDHWIEPVPVTPGDWPTQYADDAAPEVSEVGRLRSLLARLSEPWAPWVWDGTGEGIYCKRCQGHKQTTDLAHARDLDWHDESCPWRQAREEVAGG